MRIVLSWLRELCPTELGADELAELLTRRGAEVESVERPWVNLSGVIAARVIEVRDHPNSDTLCLARVQTGSGELEVVVGVRNMEPGDIVPLAPPGARVPTSPEPLGAREIRGVVSNGMLAAPDEIGVSPSHEGILILPPDVEPGTDVASRYGLDDAVLDIEVTPNRPDFLSVLGIAREVSAATGAPLALPPLEPDEADENVDDLATVEVRDADRCPRYLARVIRGVSSTAAPIEVQARLTAAGMRPISAVVDATNYAMLEVGQPLHPFDLHLLAGPGIVVRRADEGESLVTLDDVERKLTSDDLLICDVERPVAIAGVMGGAAAEVSASTTDVLLESATFRREGVQRTRRRLGLSTEASTRFERGSDPEGPPLGAGRAARLMAEWCGASVLRGALDVGGAPARRRIDVRASRASAVIGYPVARADVGDVLDRLGMAHQTVDEDTVRAEVPGYRVDVEREVDLIEEVVRVQGYDRVGSTLPPVRQPGGLPPAYAFRRRVRRALAAAGVREVRSIPFASDADLELFGDRDAIRVSNPLQADEGWLRTRVLPGLLRAASRNLARHVRSVALFETSRVWRSSDDGAEERASIAIVMTGLVETGWTSSPRAYDVFDVKGVVEAVLAQLGIAWTVGGSDHPALHPGRAGSVSVAGVAIGVFGELHPGVADRYELVGRVAVAELDADALARRASDHTEVRDVPRFPPVRRDLAFVVDAAIPAADIRRELTAAGGDLVGDVLLFDVHAGEPLAAEKKSLAFSVDLRAADRTLTDADAKAAVDRIAERLRASFGAELRSG
ncbi:MAG TPA: phenylalanine--tRNA ligase subunit beta [Actinomycetota bacterium]|nr:phenylalanine--tRNA ligase subunit beta [Actinomycetota bacterium]